MAQQRIKLVQDPSGSYTLTTEADVNTLTAQPVALDANEDFRVILRDTMTEAEVNDAVQGLVTALRDGQVVRTAAKL